MLRTSTLIPLQIDPALFQENERTAPTADTRKYAQVGDLTCENGFFLSDITVAYETWGSLNTAKDNAIWVCHAISGDSHAIGWWDRIVGPSKPIDTEKYFVVCSNSLGGCQGTTGPSSGLRSKFPQITVGDMIEVQKRLLDHLGIDQLLCVCGGSMGGMQALEWSVRFPERVRKVWMTASCAAHSALQIGYNETARQAILRDHLFAGGEYDPATPPSNGLAVARMVGHLSYLSEASFERKFGRNMQGGSAQFQVESYLNYQGDKFTKRFDANSLIVLSRAIDLYDCKSLAASQSEYLFTSFKSDTLYPSHQSKTLHEMVLAALKKSTWIDIDLPFGHDAFLLDDVEQGAALRNFL